MDIEFRLVLINYISVCDAAASDEIAPYTVVYSRLMGDLMIFFFFNSECREECIA